MMSYELLIDKSLDDLNQWLSHGYFKSKETDDIYCIEQVKRHSNILELGTNVLHNGKWVGKTITIGSEEVFNQFDFSFPEGGNINIRSRDNELMYTTYVSRMPRRQWNRSFVLNNVQLTCAVKMELKSLNRIPRSLQSNSHKDIIRNIFFPVYYDVKTALDLLDHAEAVSVAISRDFSIAYSLVSNKYLLFYKLVAVGYMQDSTFVLDPACDFLVQNLTQYGEVIYAKEESTSKEN